METLLLGAGASADAKVPTSVEMTKRIRENFEQDPELREAFEVVAFVIGGIQYQNGIKAVRGVPGIDVEDLFNAVRFLEARDTSDASPFVGSWHPRVDALDRYTSSDPRVLKFLQDFRSDILKRVHAGLSVALNQTLVTRADGREDASSEQQPDKDPRPATKGDVEVRIGDYLAALHRQWGNAHFNAAAWGGNLQRSFREAVGASIPRSSNGGIFRDTANLMIRQLITLTWRRDASLVRYLAPIFNLYREQGRLTIATLNYDNCVELAATDSSNTIVDPRIWTVWRRRSS